MKKVIWACSHRVSEVRRLVAIPIGWEIWGNCPNCFLDGKRYFQNTYRRGEPTDKRERSSERRKKLSEVLPSSLIHSKDLGTVRLLFHYVSREWHTVRYIKERHLTLNVFFFHFQSNWWASREPSEMASPNISFPEDCGKLSLISA